MAGAAGLAFCQGMQWSLPSGSTHQLQREFKNAVRLGFFAWLITRDHRAAEILCHGRCPESPPPLGREASRWVLPCSFQTDAADTILSFYVQSHQLRKRNWRSPHVGSILV